jgi:hypothetical protein
MEADSTYANPLAWQLHCGKVINAKYLSENGEVVPLDLKSPSDPRAFPVVPSAANPNDREPPNRRLSQMSQ